MDQEAERTLADIAIIEPMFETTAWRKVKESLLNELEVIKEDLLYVQTDRDAAFLQGRASQCVSIASLEDYFGNQKDAIETQEREEADADGDIRL